MVEVLGRYSNPCFRLPELQNLLAMTPVGCPVARVPSLQRQHRLKKPEIELMIADYVAGVKLNEIADRYQVNQSTIAKYVRLHGIPRRTRRLRSQEVKEAVELYASGRSTKWIGEHLGVAATTVRHSLTKARVTLRGRGRRI